MMLKTSSLNSLNDVNLRNMLYCSPDSCGRRIYTKQAITQLMGNPRYRTWKNTKDVPFYFFTRVIVNAPLCPQLF